MRALANLLPGTTYYYRIRARNEDGIITETNGGILNTPNVPDTTAPTVSITAPLNNATVAGTIAVAATASDDVVVAGVQLRIDGTLMADDTTSPYSVNLNTLALTAGAHTITAIARDAEENSRTATISITVSNPQPTPPDSTPPSAPRDLRVRSVSSDKARFSWTASTDNIAVVGYNIYRGGVKIDSTISAVYEDLAVTPEITYSYAVRAYDLQGNLSPSSATLSIKALANTAPPTAIPTISNIPVANTTPANSGAPLPTATPRAAVPTSQAPIAKAAVPNSPLQTVSNIEPPVYKIVQEENEIPVPDSITPEALYRLQIQRLPVINESLKLGMTSPDVITLQRALNALGFTVAVRGAGSPGNEDDYYSSATADAVKKFRAAYYGAPISKSATGEVNDITRHTLNTLTQGTTTKVAVIPSNASFLGWVKQYMFSFFGRIKEGVDILKS